MALNAIHAPLRNVRNAMRDTTWMAQAMIAQVSLLLIYEANINRYCATFISGTASCDNIF